MYGEDVVTGWTCQKWFAKFRARDFSLNDAPQLDRPAEVDNDQIETLIENSQCYPTREEIADILKVSRSIVIGENEKCVFYFTEKTKLTFWPMQ